MTPERWALVRARFDEVAALPPESRAGALRGVEDDSVRDEVAALLVAHEAAEADGFLGADDAERPAWIGRRLGPYRLVEEIGRGGMGVVYRARREDGAFDADVAVKVVGACVAADVVLARFRAERQILAGLDHPCIARLLDGGSTAEGSPYIVMELVEGRPLVAHAEAHALDVPARLRLFRDVCAAVHHAHQRLVIHRDLKPGNILVTAMGAPKLLDFGVAKLLSPAPALTATRAPLTPEYASPEQIAGRGVTTASDVYALGVLLHELLTGERPVPGERPSALLGRLEAATTADAPGGAARRRALRTVRHRVRGDLDTIVAKALQEEPERRYASADQLSEDVRRHLAGEPVTARPDTLGYRLGRMVRRNPAAAVMSAALLLACLAGVAGVAWQAHVARVERQRAERSLQDVRRLCNSLLFELHDAIRGLPGATAARRLVVDRAREFLAGLGEQGTPEARQELAVAYRMLGDVQASLTEGSLGLGAEARDSYERALRIQERVAAERPDDFGARRVLARCEAALADHLESAGASSEAAAHERRAMELRQALVAERPDDLDLRADLALSYEQAGFRATHANDLDAAFRAHRRQLELFESVADARPDDRTSARRVAFAHKQLGGTLMGRKDWPAALAEYRAAMAAEERRLAADPQDTRVRFDITLTYNDTGLILERTGDRPGALESYRRALAIREALAAADPQDARAREGVASSLGLIGDVLRESGRAGEALASHRRALQIHEALLATDPGNARRQFRVARAHSSLGHDSVAQAEERRTGASAREAWKDAAASLAKALEGYRAAEARPGIVFGTEVGEADRIAALLERCRTTLARGDRHIAP